MDISVIIPSLNGFKHLEKYLPSVIKAVKQSRCDAEIIVIDDNSSDGTVEHLNSLFTESCLKVLSNPKKGLCSARNYGASVSSGRFLLFIDNDVILEEDFFDKVLQYLDNHEIGAVTCAGYLMQDGRQIDGIKLLEWRRGFPRFTRNILNERIIKNDNDGYYSYGLQGAYFLYRRSLFDDIGGVNELLEPYMLDDADLAYKALKTGYKIAYAHDTKCLHYCGGTISSKTSERTRYLSIRNRYIFVLLHIHSLSLLLQTFLMVPFRLFYSAERKALKEVFAMRKEILSARKIEKERAVVSDKALLRMSAAYAKSVAPHERG